jgi:hypothetical protein
MPLAGVAPSPSDAEPSQTKGGDHEAPAPARNKNPIAGALEADIHELLFYAHKHAAAACFPRGFDVAAFEAAIAPVPLFLRSEA